MQVFYLTTVLITAFSLPGELPGPRGVTEVRHPSASRKKEAKGAAPGRRQKAPSGDKGTQKTKKASVAPKEK